MIIAVLELVEDRTRAHHSPWRRRPHAEVFAGSDDRRRRSAIGAGSWLRRRSSSNATSPAHSLLDDCLPNFPA
jgi:hypothetical protein